VVGCGRRVDRGKKVETHIRSAGGSFTFVEADVTVRSDCQRFIDTAVAEHGRVDVLINNAGGGGDSVATDELAESDFDALLRLNLHSALFCSQAAIGDMLRRGEGGLILSIASVQGVLAVARSLSYNAAKAALIQMSNTMAVEYLERGIRSNVIVMGGAPTAASAEAVRQLTKSMKGTDAEPDFGQYLPAPVSGTPLRDVATALVALAGDDARAITGASIAIDQAQTAGSMYSEAIFHALSGEWKAP
jgi:NAD(P)-dependent dehydrogenase (short-subunit alcohol dehydrogenase family)